jgi:phosphate transport system substrate-binding protein
LKEKTAYSINAGERNEHVVRISLRPPVRCFFSLLAAVLIGFLSGCGRGAAQRGVVAAGSTSVQPFADHWAEIYMREYPGRVVNIQGGGSSAGIQAAREGAADIGMSSRELKSEEKDLSEVIVAWDGLAVIVHPENRTEDLSLEQVQNIFVGNITNWATLGGPNHPITVVTREEGSGTRGAFQEMVMRKNRIAREAIVQDSNGTVREIVANDPQSIGYISLGLVNEKVKAVRVDGVEASFENIERKKYSLIRPFLFVTNGPPNAAARDFIDFVLSRPTQETVRHDGLIPIFKE